MLAAQPASFALLIDLRAVVPWARMADGPAATSPVRLALEHAGQSFVLQPGRTAEAAGSSNSTSISPPTASPSMWWRTRTVGWRELPWRWMLALGRCSMAALRRSHRGGCERQRAERQRAEELLRLGQVARLNTWANWRRAWPTN